MVQYITNGEDAGKAHQIILGYWGIRGLAQPIRYLLVCAGVPSMKFDMVFMRMAL